MVSKEFEETISDFIDFVCLTLDIEEPAYTFDAELATSTTMAAYSPSHDLLYMNPNYCVDYALPLMMVCVAHEMRHKWQHKNNSQVFSGYKKSSEIDLNTYNKQAVEIDANAFAVAFMDKYLSGWDKTGLRNKFLGNAETKKRYKEIKRTFN